MLLRFLLIVSALALPIRAAGTLLSIHATNFVSLSPGPGGDMLVAGSTGQPLAQGRVHLGTFADGFNPGIAVTSLDFGALVANFTAVANGPILTPEEWDAMGFSGTELAGFYNLDASNLTWPATQLDRDIFLFIGNGATLATSSELGLVRHFARIPSNPPPEFLLSNPIDTTEPDYFRGSIYLTAGPVSQVMAGEIMLGSVGSHNMSDPYLGFYDGPMNTLQLVAVPETSTPVFLILAGLALVYKRARGGIRVSAD